MPVSGKKKALESTIKKIPGVPGVYEFYDASDTIIYVGKAKNLKKRVSSYFLKNKANGKTRAMVNQIGRISYHIVDSEFDAFLLENNLIKKYNPKYNIRLKDDKSFPYICIIDERFPRIISTRRRNLNRGTYYGPYANVKAMKAVMDLIQKLYKLRTCNYNLSEKNILNKKFKVCLEYHIGNCLGPCEGLQSEDDYMKDIAQVELILKGNVKQVKTLFQKEMKEASSNLAFEHAQRVKEKIDLLEKYQHKSMVVNEKIKETEVYTIISDDKKAWINFIKITNGSIINSENIEVKKRLDENEESLLEQIIFDLRKNYQSRTKEILTNKKISNSFGEDVHVHIPSRGDKKKLIDLSVKNALYYKKEKAAIVKPRENEEVKSLQEVLSLKELPNHIECFDNSNFQGSFPVASMVCFKNGKPSKKDYRHFNIKEITGIDDFGSMKEVVGRRYKRLLEEKETLPDLIVIDGGKGQLNAAVQALKEQGIYGKVAIIGIAKKLEEIYTPKDELPLHINKKSGALKLIQKIRNEAHRFAINFHRDKRSKGAIQTTFEDIPGIGATTAQKLLRHFKSLNGLKAASEEEIAAVIGPDKSKKIVRYLKK